MKIEKQHPIEKAILAFEKRMGLWIHIGDASGRLRPFLPAGRFRHESRCCTHVKETGGVNRCIAFEGSIKNHQRMRSEKCFLKLCHAGILDVTVPIKIDHEVLGHVSTGPFKYSGQDELPPISVTAKRGRPLPKAIAAELESVTMKELGDVAELTLMLASRIESLLAEELSVPLQARDRQEQIECFIRSRISRQLTLKHLATYLNLSASRTSHVVNETFGITFPKLVISRRLDYACRLLEHSAHPVVRIAERCGFQDPNYFYVVFKKEKGMTPRTYRQEKLDQELLEA